MTSTTNEVEVATRSQEIVVAGHRDFVFSVGRGETVGENVAAAENEKMGDAIARRA